MGQCCPVWGCWGGLESLSSCWRSVTHPWAQLGSSWNPLSGAAAGRVGEEGAASAWNVPLSSDSIQQLIKALSWLISSVWIPPDCWELRGTGAMTYSVWAAFIGWIVSTDGNPGILFPLAVLAFGYFQIKIHGLWSTDPLIVVGFLVLVDFNLILCSDNSVSAQKYIVHSLVLRILRIIVE